MRSLLRNPWVSLAALAAYLAVNVGARALHHHQVPSVNAGPATADGSAVHFQQDNPALDHEDDESTCPLCSVLHLAQSVVPIATLEASVTAVGPVATASPTSRSYPLPAILRCRAPPASVALLA